MRRLFLVLAVLAAGCGGGDDDVAQPTRPGETTATATSATGTSAEERDELTLRVYFVRDGKMGVTTREVPRTQSVATVALAALVDGPTAEERAAGLTTAVPPDTGVSGVRIADGEATVDLTSEFAAGGGSASMLLRVAQVVYTLTQFPTVRRVSFELEGAAVEAIGGEGVVVSPAVDRGDFEQQTPAILVESVGPGDEVRSPLRVTGTANTFEATLDLRVVDANGKVLYDDFATATSGTGTRGTFDETLDFDVESDGPGTLVAYERSAENGAEVNVVRIPVELRR